MIMGKFLSYLALEIGKFTTYLPAYGAEVRGGTAHCMVIISDSEIYSPFIEKADTVIVMNEPSLTKFEKRARKSGLFLINKSLISRRPKRKDCTIKKAPFTEIASSLGNIKCANTVALGAYLAIKKIASTKEIHTVLDKMLSGLNPDIVQVNEQALQKGMSYGKS